jgi:hypothetical protein
VPNSTSRQLLFQTSHTHTWFIVSWAVGLVGGRRCENCFRPIAIRRDEGNNGCQDHTGHRTCQYDFAKTPSCHLHFQSSTENVKRVACGRRRVFEQCVKLSSVAPAPAWRIKPNQESHGVFHAFFSLRRPTRMTRLSCPSWS